MGCGNSSAAGAAKTEEKSAGGKKGYCIGFFDFKKTPQEFKDNYASKADGTLKPYGGKFLCKHAIPPPMAEKMGHKKACTFGEPGQMAFIVEFPDFEAALKWFNGPEYGAVLGLRDEHAAFRMTICEGPSLSYDKAGICMGFFDFIKPPADFKTTYSPVADKTLQPYKGGFVSKQLIPPEMAEKMGMKKTVHFGDPGQMAFLVEFPDFETATKWFNGPEYGGILGLRDEHAAFRMAIVEKNC